MTQAPPRHKVFISFHHDNQNYKDRFVEMMERNFVDKSVHDDDIDDTNIPAETIRQKIRDEFIADATVTVVLIGPCTWQRKHVDWEISSSLRDTNNNPRCGLLGLLLPNHRNFKDFANKGYERKLIPPRLADNVDGDNPFAIVDRWSGSNNEANRIRRLIHQAYLRRDKDPAPNIRTTPPFARNRPGDCSRGWQ